MAWHRVPFQEGLVHPRDNVAPSMDLGRQILHRCCYAVADPVVQTKTAVNVIEVVWRDRRLLVRLCPVRCRQLVCGCDIVDRDGIRGIAGPCVVRGTLAD